MRATHLAPTTIRTDLARYRTRDTARDRARLGRPAKPHAFALEFTPPYLCPPAISSGAEHHATLRSCRWMQCARSGRVVACRRHTHLTSRPALRQSNGLAIRRATATPSVLPTPQIRARRPTIRPESLIQANPFQNSRESPL